MRIRAFHIDGFGILSNVTVDDLPRGMSVFLGHNEAGKSTCLEFFRTMLTGYPLPRTKESRKSWAMSGQKQGGSLHLDMDDGSLLRLVRRPGAGGGVLTLLDADGNQLDPAEYDHILGGVNREIYRNIYGFSLSELQTFSSLDSEAVKNALYGAGFGTGLNSPGAALGRMQSAMDEIFKARGKNQPLNVALKDWDDLRRGLREAEEDAARYDALYFEYRAARVRLDELHRDKDELEAERRDLERRLGVWKQWEEWQLAQARLARLEEVAESFPVDGISRLDRLLDRREAAQRQASLVDDRLARLRASLEELDSKPELLPLADMVRELSERKSSCRNALISLPTLRANYQRAEETLARQLSALGPGWDMDRIRSMDRSLFVREELERQSSAMQAAESSIMALAASLERANHDAEQSRNTAEFARQTLRSLPEPVAELDAPAREILHTQMMRLDESRQRLPERERALASSRSEYSRALSYLNLRPDASASQLQTLADAQEQALALADEVRARTEEAQAAKQEVQAARKEEEAASDRLQRIESQEREIAGSDRKALDTRRISLRRLRQTSALVHQEEDRLLDLNERYTVQEASSPRPKSRKLLLAIGALLALTGGSMLLAQLGFHIETVDLAAWWGVMFGETAPPSWAGVVSLHMWAGYAILSVGVLALAMGWPHAGPDRARNEVQLDQLRSRRDASAAKLAELEQEVKDLCAELGLDAADAAALDECEVKLDQEREQLATNERLQQEKALLQSELDVKRRQLQSRENEHNAAESAVQGARRRWHDYLARQGVMNVPSPDAASAFFARVESTRMARTSTTNIEQEIEELRGRGYELIQSAREILPSEALPSWLAGEDHPRPRREDAYTREELGSVVDAVRTVLDSCRQAEALVEERARATEALRAAEASSERFGESCIAAEQSLREAQAKRDAINSEWQEYLQELGLDLHLSPVTTREALDCMERCIGAEAECNRLREEIAMQERERDALALPLAVMLEENGRSPHLALDKQPDWLATLDILQRDVDRAHRTMEEEQRLAGQIRDVEEELRVARAAETDACKAVDELLALAGADNPEAFRRQASVLDEKTTLLRRCQDLEDALQLAAGETSLDEFLDEFAGMEKGNLDFRGAELTHRLETLRDEEQRQASEVASLDARLQELAASDRLAELRRKEASLAEEVSRLSRDWSRYALARQLLRDARRHYEKERQPEVVRLASDIFSSITGGAWPQITASLEDGSLLAVPDHGDPVPPEDLSRGAQEQMYLALRLAHIRGYSRRAISLPVVMDDIMVNFDPERMERTMKALADLTLPEGGDNGHQVLFFTCHPFMADKLLDIVPESSLFHIRSGKFSRQ